MSAKSAVMKFDAGENLFAKVEDLIMDLITASIDRLQSETSADDDPFAKAKQFIADLI